MLVRGRGWLASSPSSSSLFFGRSLARSLCAAPPQSVRRRNALVVLGLEEGATARQIKMKYFDLAKRTHPDMLNVAHKEAAAAATNDVGPKVVSYAAGAAILDATHAAAPTAASFLEIQAAYDALMEEGDESGRGGASRRNARRPGQAATARARTLGEVLCDRLRDEPEVHALTVALALGLT